MGKRPYGMNQAELLEWLLINRAAWDGQCLIWRGGRSHDGYAYAWVDGRNFHVTRLILAERGGVGIRDLEAGVYALHSCGRGHEGCVTPEHIRPGSQKDNMADARLDGRHNGARVRCPRGHLLAGANLVPSELRRGKRKCLCCDRVRGHVVTRRKPLEEATRLILDKYPEMARAALGQPEGETTMMGSLTDPQRTDWRDDYETGEQVSTLYKGTWVKGVVKGNGVKDLLKVDVLPNEQTGAFVGRLTTKDGVRKDS